MGLFRYRIVSPDGRTSRWADWSSTPSAMLLGEMREGMRGEPRGAARGGMRDAMPLPIPGRLVLVDVPDVLAPPPLVELDDVKEMVQEYSEDYLTRPRGEFG